MTRARSATTLLLALAFTVAPLAAQEARPEPRLRRVAVLVFEGVELLDFSGPAEVFSAARGKQGRAFQVRIVAKTRDPVLSQGFLRIVPQATLADEPEPDIVVVPGGSVPVGDAAVREWVTRTAKSAEVVLSVCNGAMMLGRCGLLDGLEATTHHGSLESLMLSCPKTTVLRDVRWVDNGRIVTCGGVSAGIDGALHVVSRLCGREVAKEAATYMEYAWRGDERAAVAISGEPREDEAAVRQLASLLAERPVEEALAAWSGWKASKPAAELPDVERLNALAYRMLSMSDDGTKALRWFEFNVAAFPDSANAHDSLSEANERLGRWAEACAWAKKALAKLESDTSLSEEWRERVEDASTDRLRRLDGAAAGAAIEWVCPPCDCGQHERSWPEPGTCEACNMRLVPRAPNCAAATAARAVDPAIARRIEELSRALDAGTRSASEVLADPAFDDLHGVAAFRDLMKAKPATGTVRLASDAEPGTRLEVSGRVVDASGRGVAGALVHVFHTDASGRYTRGGMDESRARLFAWLRTDADGRFTLRTIRPGAYPVAAGERRMPQHIHGTVEAGGREAQEFTVYFDDDPLLDRAQRRDAAAGGGLVVRPAADAEGRQSCSLEIALRPR